MRNAETVLGIIRSRRDTGELGAPKGARPVRGGADGKVPRSNSPAAYSTSTTAATRGTSSPISLGSSCPSACGTGLTGSNQGDLVLSDISDQTLIDPGSALFAKISTLKVGQKVVFSGTFTRSETDCIKETSLTLS